MSPDHALHRITGSMPFAIFRVPSRPALVSGLSGRFYFGVCR